jgi:hypothetical protein
MKKTILLIAVLVALIVSAQAQTHKRTLRQERKRTAQGIRSGQITKGEALVIKKQARDVRQAKGVARADGIVGPKERAVIAQQKGQLNRTISRAKHNNRTRK